MNGTVRIGDMWKRNEQCLDQTENRQDETRVYRDQYSFAYQHEKILYVEKNCLTCSSVDDTLFICLLAHYVVYYVLLLDHHTLNHKAMLQLGLDSKFWA